MLVVCKVNYNLSIVGYLCEGRDLFQCIGYNCTVYMDYMDLTVHYLRKAVKLTGLPI